MIRFTVFFIICTVLLSGWCIYDLAQIRSDSARKLQIPMVNRIEIGGEIVWEKEQGGTLKAKAGDQVTIYGEGFGEGPDTDYSKILIGKVRALERDLPMYEGAVDLIQQLFYERNVVVDQWTKDIKRWTNSSIEFRMPDTAISGPLIISVQKRVDWIPNLAAPLFPLRVKDPLTERIESGFDHFYDLVSRVSTPILSESIPAEIENPAYAEMLHLGEAVFWQYDYNIGLVHHLKKLDWDRTLWGENLDPLTGEKMDPVRDFGAVQLKQGEVPNVAVKPYFWKKYPLQQPLKPLLGSPKTKGTVKPTGFVGYVRAESKGINGKNGAWIGFNCVSCHGQRITYESAPGVTVSKVFAGLPNPNWSMKWALMGGGFPSLKSEKGFDRSLIVRSVPNGTGEHTLIRSQGDGSIYDDDSLFSPIAIPIITQHTPVRRALSRTEMIAGFEGSYIHSEEPDGAIGAMFTEPLKALTVYMTTLNENDETLGRVGMYRWLKRKEMLGDIGNISEGVFVQNGGGEFPALQTRISRGKESFDRDCRSCHQENFGTWSDENHFPFNEVGTYFSPTLFHRQVQSVRTAIIRNLAWVEPRGLLHDGHVKTMEDLVDPDRCTEGSSLHNHYYTIHEGSFKIPKGNPDQERSLRKVHYFTEVSWDTRHLYWDYQKMRREFGVVEFGTSKPVPLPASPHPWCTKSKAEVDDLVAFLLTL